MQVTFTGTKQEVIDEVAGFLNSFGFAVTYEINGCPALPVVQLTAVGEDTPMQMVDLDVRHPHGNTPRPDASVEQTQPADAFDPAEDTDSSDPVSYDEALAALKAYTKLYGKAKAIKILTKYNVDRLSELKEFGSIYEDLNHG